MNMVVSNNQSFSSEILAHELIPAGWRVRADVRPSAFLMHEVEFMPFFRLGEFRLPGSTMLHRAAKVGLALGLADLKMI